MFIRRTQTRSRVSGEPYVTYRLVHSVRVGSAVKQWTLLNLGSHFDLPQAHWPALAQRIDELVHGQRSVLEDTLPEQVQAFAQRFAAQIIARQPAVPSLDAAPGVPAVLAASTATPAPSPSLSSARCGLNEINSLELLCWAYGTTFLFARRLSSRPVSLPQTSTRWVRPGLGSSLRMAPSA